MESTKLTLDKIQHKHSFYSFAPNTDQIILKVTAAMVFFTQMVNLLTTPSTSLIINANGTVSPATPQTLANKLKLKKLYFQIFYRGLSKLPLEI